MTKKISLLTLLVASSLFGIEIPTEYTQKRSFAKSVALNAQVIQLSNASQSVTTQISGHLEKYYVQAGQKVTKGQKIALLESITVSKMTADFIAYKKQYEAIQKNYEAMKKLYEGGMTSMQALNRESIKKDAIAAQINRLQSQLKLLNIDTKNLHVASANFTLYAHSSGVVSKLLLPLHAVVRVDEAVIKILKEQAFYIKSFVPLSYASKVEVGEKIVVDYNGRSIMTHITQILPAVDETTQRIVVLSSVDEIANDLYINAFVKSTLYFKADKKYVAIKKSALSFFNNEWVVFVPTQEHEEEAQEHEEEGDHHHEEHMEVPYEARVVKIVAQNEKYVGIEGLSDKEEYVSEKSYYVKSMMLKSSLGEHGH